MNKLKKRLRNTFPFFGPKVKTIRNLDKKWTAIWVIIYVGFIVFDLFLPKFEMLSTLIKYTGIFLCVIYAYSRHKDDARLCIALLLTLLADAILMFLGWKLIGLFIFCFAQFFHTMRLSNTDSKFLMTYFLIVFLVFSTGLLNGLSAIYVLAFIYASSLVMNINLSYQWFKSAPKKLNANYCYYGFVLFLLCDVCVALGYLGGVGEVPLVVANVASFLVFVFYYPSQVLLSNSSTLTNIKS
jgi:hypothetical protein